MGRQYPFLVTLLIAALATSSSLAGTQARDITSLLPGVTPAFLVIKDPAGFAGRLRSFGDPGSPAAETADGGIGDLLGLIGLNSVPEGVDLKGKILLAMPQFPFPLIALTVTDYDLFLRSLTPPGEEQAPSPMPGIDMVTVAGKPLFSRNEGEYALLSPMPILLTPPAEGASLGGVLSAGEKEILAGSEAFLRLDVGMILALAEPFLRQSLAGLESGAAAPDGDEAAQARKLLQAETDLLLQGLRQVRAINVGAALGEGGLSLSTAYLPQPGSGFETIISHLEPDDGKLLGLFDADAAMAGSFHFDYALMGELVETMTSLLFDSGIYGLEEADRETWRKMVKEGLEVAGKRSAMYFGPPKSGGAFSTLVVSEVKDTAKARALMKDSLWFAEKVLAGPAVKSPGLAMEFLESVEKHGGVAIDEFRFIFEAPEDPPGDEKARGAMEALFGGDHLSVWTAFFDDYLVASYYAPTTGDIKGMIDRLRGGGSGGLTSSPAFIEATAGLPAGPSSLFFVSLPRFMSLVTEMAQKVDSGEGLPPWPVGSTESSGIGVAYSGRGGALRVDSYIPKREAVNIRRVFEYFKGLEKKNGDAPPKSESF
jgi:hypothetical protein